VFVAVNLDPTSPQEANVQVPLWKLGLAPQQSYEMEDLLKSQRYAWRGEWGFVRLDPDAVVAHIFRLHRAEPRA
jgi:starch synthase (maltosyl-transferring)